MCIVSQEKSAQGSTPCNEPPTTVETPRWALVAPPHAVGRWADLLLPADVAHLDQSSPNVPHRRVRSEELWFMVRAQPASALQYLVSVCIAGWYFAVRKGFSQKPTDGQRKTARDNCGIKWSMITSSDDLSCCLIKEKSRRTQFVDSDRRNTFDRRVCICNHWFLFLISFLLSY